MLWYYRPYSNLLPLFERFATIFDEEIKWFSNEQPKFHYMTFMLINRYLWLFWKHIIHFTMIRYYTILHRPKKIKKIWLLMGRLNVFFYRSMSKWLYTFLDMIYWILWENYEERFGMATNLWTNKNFSERDIFRTQNILNEEYFERGVFRTHSFERGSFWTTNILNKKSFKQEIFWIRKLLNEIFVTKKTLKHQEIFTTTKTKTKSL